MNTEKGQLVTITDTRIMNLVGCVFYGDPFHEVGGWDTENEIGLTWKRFMNLYQKNREILEKYRIAQPLSYEIHIEPEEYKKEKKLYIFVGIDVSEIKEVPLEMFGLTLPATKYAKMTTVGSNMFSGGNYLWDEWLPGSQFKESYPFLIQVYDESRFKGMHSEDSELDWMIPIKAR